MNEKMKKESVCQCLEKQIDVVMKKIEKSSCLPHEKAEILEAMGNLQQSSKAIEEMLSLTIRNNDRDALTGLHSRAYFFRVLSDLEMNRAFPFCLIYGDVNNLKLTNDVFGHEAGDLLMITLSDILRDEIGKDDIISRIGGDEITILLMNTRKKEADEFCDRVRRRCATTNRLKYPASISMGVVEVSDMSTSMTENLAEAEKRMYAEKTVYKSTRNIFSDVQDELFRRGILDRNVIRQQKMLASDFAKFLGMTTQQIEQLCLAAEFQDIGLLAVPMEIACKTVSRTPEETMIMRMHVEAGFRLVRLYNETFQISNLVLQSHEAWSGLGYPRGLKGDEILPEAQVLYLCTQFVKWTTERPFGSGLDIVTAYHRLDNKAGDQFNPLLIQKLKEYLIQKGWITKEDAEKNMVVTI